MELATGSDRVSHDLPSVIDRRGNIVVGEAAAQRAEVNKGTGRALRERGGQRNCDAHEQQSGEKNSCFHHARLVAVRVIGNSQQVPMISSFPASCQAAHEGPTPGPSPPRSTLEKVAWPF